MAALTKEQLEESDVRDLFESLADTLSGPIKEETRVTVVYDMLIVREDYEVHGTIGRVAIFKQACDGGEHPLFNLETLPKQIIQCLDDGNYLWVKGSVVVRDGERCFRPLEDE